jgi:hypothetical protein
MADTPSIVIVQKFTYRGAPEEFSNRYHFNGTVPSSDAEWNVLADALVANLRPIFNSLVSFVRAYGYHAGIVPSVWGRDYTLAPSTPQIGSGAVGGTLMPGDVAATTRWETGALNSRGRKIYLRKYWHGVQADPAQYDQLWATQKAAFQTLAGKLTDGTGFGGDQVLAGPHGVTAGAHVTSQWLTTRTLKRRGRRPLP